MIKETNDAWVNAHYGHDTHPIADSTPAAAQDAVAEGGDTVCPVIRLAPGEYTDWEKRVWRRGVIEAVTQPDIALAANISALIER